jgi:hypothetical protein
MSASHLLAGQHVKNGECKKADSDRDHCDIEHDYLGVGTATLRCCGNPGAALTSVKTQVLAAWMAKSQPSLPAFRQGRRDNSPGAR